MVFDVDATIGYLLVQEFNPRCDGKHFSRYGLIVIWLDRTVRSIILFGLSAPVRPVFGLTCIVEFGTGGWQWPQQETMPHASIAAPDWKRRRWKPRRRPGRRLGISCGLTSRTKPGVVPSRSPALPTPNRRAHRPPAPPT